MSSSTSSRVDALLHAVCEAWEHHSGATLPLHQLQTSNSAVLKEFCVGLLENPDTHPWNRALSRVDSRRRLSVAASLFLFRKAVPAEWDEGEMCKQHRSVAIPALRSSPRPSPPKGYLDHVRRITSETFPFGWDHKYRSKCWSSAPSVGACLEASRSKGGSRSLHRDRAVFLRRSMGLEYFEVDNTVRYSVVPSGGKGRGVTVASAEMGVLSPLHQTTYDHLSTLPWLLRGEARPSCFKDFTRVDGEVFVSGDYVNASDGLSILISETILDVMESRSKWVPSTVWNVVRQFLRCKIKYPDLEVPLPSEIQLMGSLMCFPLLCLQNYIAFRWTFPASTPVKINGDDIVFRGTKEKYLVWAGSVGELGLTLSRGKTLVSEVYFSLNSSFFWSRQRRKPRLVPVTRVAGFTSKFEEWSSLSGIYHSLTRGFIGQAKLSLEVTFLRRFRKEIRQAGRSVRRGLEVSCSVASLRMAGLWRRECWMMETLEKSVDQLPPSPSSFKWKSIPDGWKRVDKSSCVVSGSVKFHSTCVNEPCTCCIQPRKGYAMAGSRMKLDVDELQRAFWREVAAETWRCSPTKHDMLSEYRAQVISTGYERAWLRWRRPPRLRCLVAFHKRKFCSPRMALEWVKPPRARYVWIPKEEVECQEGYGDFVPDVFTSLDFWSDEALGELIMRS